MNSAIIDKGSKSNDILCLLTGEWTEFDRDNWHVVKTPFFVSVTSVVSAGPQALPFQVKNPAPGILYKADNSVEAIVVRPGDTAVNFTSNGLFKMDLFGDMADVRPIL